MQKHATLPWRRGKFLRPLTPAVLPPGVDEFRPTSHHGFDRSSNHSAFLWEFSAKHASTNITKPSFCKSLVFVHTARGIGSEKNRPTSRRRPSISNTKPDFKAQMTPFKCKITKFTNTSSS